MKLRVVTIILSVLLLVAIAYVVLVTIAANETIDGWSVKYDEVAGKYSDAIENYKELYDKYKEMVEDDLSTPIVVSTIAKQIDENAVVSVFDERVVHIIVPYSDNIKDKVEEVAWMLPSSLGTYEYESCIITVVDETGKCAQGWTICETGETDYFISASFVAK